MFTMHISYKERSFQIDWQQPIVLALPLREGTENPNCYYAEAPRFETIRMGSFVGSVAEGGACNYQQLTLTPHGNGTHTECYGHISPDPEATIAQCMQHTWGLAEVLSVKPQQRGEDQVICLEDLQALRRYPDTQALVIRTLPNSPAKVTAQYSNSNPPYFEASIGQYLAEQGVLHWLVDLPSLDREQDGGALLCHKAFWQYPAYIRKEASVSELLYIPDEVEDGLYFIDIQIININSDASPSRPILYRLL